jgi:hypothetical protein
MFLDNLLSHVASSSWEGWLCRYRSPTTGRNWYRLPQHPASFGLFIGLFLGKPAINGLHSVSS